MGSFGGDHLKLKTKKGKPYTQQHVISRLVPVIYSPLLCNNLFTWVYYDYLSQKEPQNMPQKSFTPNHERLRETKSSLFLFQVKIWFQNRRSKYKKMMKAPGGSVGAPPNMLTGQPLGSSSPPPSDSPMGGMHQGNTPNSQGQMSPGPSIGPPSNHSPQQHHQQQQQHHHPQYPGHHGGHPQQHPNGVGYGHVPQATPSPHGGDMSPSQHHMHSHGGGGGGSPPGWHSIHQQQDIKPPMNPAAAAAAAAAHGMFPQYSWYQTTDNNMNQGLLT